MRSAPRGRKWKCRQSLAGVENPTDRPTLAAQPPMLRRSNRPSSQRRTCLRPPGRSDRRRPSANVLQPALPPLRDPSPAARRAATKRETVRRGASGSRPTYGGAPVVLQSVTCRRATLNGSRAQKAKETANSLHRKASCCVVFIEKGRSACFQEGLSIMVRENVSEPAFMIARPRENPVKRPAEPKQDCVPAVVLDMGEASREQGFRLNGCR